MVFWNDDCSIMKKICEEFTAKFTLTEQMMVGGDDNLRRFILLNHDEMIAFVIQFDSDVKLFVRNAVIILWSVWINLSSKLCFVNMYNENSDFEVLPSVQNCDVFGLIAITIDFEWHCVCVKLVTSCACFGSRRGASLSKAYWKYQELGSDLADSISALEL